MIIIKSIHIKNFRSIVEETIELSDFNCFVGKNDSGKSNVLKALNLFFNGKTDFNTDFDFQNDYSKFAKRGQKQAREVSISLDIVVPDTFKESGVKQWRKVWRAEGLHSDNLSTLFKAASKGNTLFDRIKYLYIPAVKSNEYFKDLLSDVYTSMTKAANSSLKDLNEKYSSQLQTLTIDLSKQIQDVLKIHSAIQMPANLNTLFRDLSFSTSDKFVKNIDLNHRGDGIKARHIPSILRYMQKNTENGRPRGSVSGSYIWGFEEPENGVEYLSCYEMAAEFYSYIDDCQILITTHSPAFYTQSRNAKSMCFSVQKDEKGASKYTTESANLVNEMMGLMQIVAPFVQAVKEELIQQSQSAYHNLNTQLSEVMNIMRRADQQLDVKQVLSIIEQYSDALNMLDDYDHQRLNKPQGRSEVYQINYEECKDLIAEMKFSAESDRSEMKKTTHLRGVLGIYISHLAEKICIHL